MAISVSIVCYNTPDDELRQCLESLATSEVDVITVVDNSKSAGTALLARAYPKVRYIPNENTGYGAGHNIALRDSISRGVKYHLVLNSDVRFDPEILTTLACFMDQNPDVALSHPRLVYPDGSLQYTCRLLPTPLNLFARRFLPLLGRRLDRRYLMKEYDHERRITVPYVQGSFMLMRTAALEQVGLFDERYFMYPEDIDLSRRLLEAYDVVYFPEVSAVHDHRASSYHNRRMLRIHLSNMVRYFNKWGWLFDKSRRQINKRIAAQYKE